MIWVILVIFVIWFVWGESWQSAHDINIIGWELEDFTPRILVIIGPLAWCWCLCRLVGRGRDLMKKLAERVQP